MSKTGSVVKGAAGGAVAGSAFGPYGTAIGAVGGGIYGYLTDTSDEQEAAEKQKLAGFQAGADTYRGYRPQATAARQQGLKQQLSAYNGAGSAMGLMYGNSYNPASYAPDLENLPTPSSYAPTQGAAVGKAAAGASAPVSSASVPDAQPPPPRQHTGPSTGSAGYDAAATKAVQARTGRSDLWVDGAGNVHQVGGTNAGIVSPF